MTFGLVDWLLMAGAAYLGYNFITEPTHKLPKPHPDMGRHLLSGPIRKRLGPGDIIQVANGSPYNYEQDGNYL